MDRKASRSSRRSPPTHPTVDLRFYRAAYHDACDLSDAELLADVQAGRVPQGRALNATSFIKRAFSNGLLPKGFDPFYYRVNHPELWGPHRAEWEAMLHYLKTGKDQNSGWEREFDRSFYHALYLPDLEGPTDEWLFLHYAAHPGRYANLKEVAVRNGWSSLEWTESFNSESYLTYNSLSNRLIGSVQALVHFMEEGWRERLPISIDREFDANYFNDLAGTDFSQADSQHYRVWIESGLASSVPSNELQHLRKLGLDLPCFPKGFDWRAYLDSASIVSAQGHKLGRWDALEHLVKLGVLDGKAPLAVQTDELPNVLLAAADRFAICSQEDEACRCYERALLQSAPTVKLFSHAADQALRTGHYARALSLYRRARTAATPSFWTLHNGAEAAFSLGELEEAAEWVLAGLAAHPRNARLFELLLKIQQSRFDRAVLRHTSALRAGRPWNGISAELDIILDLFMAAQRANFGEESQPSRAISGAPLSVIILANKDLPQCTYYRVDLKDEQLGSIPGLNLRIFERTQYDQFRSAAATADIAILYRVASDVELLRSIASCRAIGIPILFEIDDLVFDAEEFPESLDSYDGAITEEEHFGLRAGVALIRHAIGCCDAAVTSTENLADRVRNLVGSGVAIVHRNGLSNALSSLAQASRPRVVPAEAAPVTLFYGSGTRAHGADFRNLLIPALMRLMADRPEVCVVVSGYVETTDLAMKFPGRVEHTPFVADRDAYLSQLMAVDINLAVIAPTGFNDCKSEIKWLEAAAFCVPSVVSDVAGFRETLSDGIHLVRVAPDPKAWYAALRDLVTDTERRISIGRAARDRALELYSPNRLGKTLAEALWDVARKAIPSLSGNGAREVTSSKLRPKVSAHPRRKRVLLANVFFPPQSYGGATRVVRDLAAELLAKYRDDYDVGIICSNEEQTVPYLTETYGWRSAPVWSVSAPHREHMDWIPFDPLMAAPIDAILDRFDPDLVHAHCIQRLTATSLECVKRRGVPYVVTAHDAWWISDHQFLTDGHNRIRMPWEAERYGTTQNVYTRSESLSRRLQLRRVLDEAAAVSVVSESFADIYRRAGVAKAVALPNAVPDLPPLRPVPGVSGRLRLAYLGGGVVHKGYFLLRQALVLGRYRTLDLLIVDHSMASGEERHEVWGSTPVCFTGKVAQDQVGDLYGRFDVLCAPSLWPESFGLVTREAMHYGKRVIASSQGAVSEDIVHDVSGWIFDISDPLALRRILTEIDDDPRRFASVSKAPSKGVRTLAHHTADVIRMYEDVLRTRSPELVPISAVRTTANIATSTGHCSRYVEQKLTKDTSEISITASRDKGLRGRRIRAAE